MNNTTTSAATAAAAAATTAAAAASQSQSSPSPPRKRKHDAEAADSSPKSGDFSLKPEVKGGSARGKYITIETFEAFLGKGYTVKDSDEVLHSGDNKFGHSLYFENGLIFCRACNKQLAYKRVTQHIVGKNHLDKVTNHLRRHQESLVNGDSLEGDDDSVAGDETSMQTEIHELPVQDEAIADAKKQSATKRKKATKTAAGDGESQNSHPIMQDGLLVVNGVDVGKYIRGLEERISELERKQS